MAGRIAVYGGSFDPFHLGHLVPTVRALETFHFEAVHFVPAGEPPHKLADPLTPVTHRLAMIATATLHYEGFYASDAEVFTDGPSYTVDTVRRFVQRFSDKTVYFIMGSDSFSQIGSWERWRDLVDLAHLVVLHRSHMWGDKLKARVPEEIRDRMLVVAPFEEVADVGAETFYLLNREPFPISGTSIRERQGRGLPIRELVPHEVFSYIEKYGLYRHREDTA